MPAPTVVSATINAAATQITVVWSEAVDSLGPDLVVRVPARNATLSATFVSGNGTDTTVWTLFPPRRVYLDETAKLDDPGDTVENGLSTPSQPATDIAVTNNSAVQRKSGRVTRSVRVSRATRQS